MTKAAAGWSNRFLRGLRSCLTAAKPIEEQKNDDSPERLPQAKAPLWEQQRVEMPYQGSWAELVTEVKVK